MTQQARQPIRVLWLAKGLGPGGMERLLVNHAKRGDRERFEYHAAYLVERPNSVVPELEALGVECTNFHGERDLDPRWLRRLHRLVRDKSIDVVHIHSPMPAAMARPMLRVTNLFDRGSRRPRLVYTEHNTWDCYGLPTRIANGVTYVLDDAQIAVSRDARECVPRRLKKRIEPITHGIDIEAVAAHRAERDQVRSELGLADDDVLAITVAHLRTEKAYDVLLDAAAIVLRQHPNARFISVGHGPLKDQLAEQHKTLGLGDRFRFLGFRSDVLNLMAAADIFVLSSHQEGLPVAFMEATALGLPAVTTAVGGLTDHIQDGETGLLVQAGDPQALADGIGRLVANHSLREGIGRRVDQRAPDFDSLAAIRSQELIYARLAPREGLLGLAGP